MFLNYSMWIQNEGIISVKPQREGGGHIHTDFIPVWRHSPHIHFNDDIASFSYYLRNSVSCWFSVKLSVSVIEEKQRGGREILSRGRFYFLQPAALIFYRWTITSHKSDQCWGRNNRFASLSSHTEQTLWTSLRARLGLCSRPALEKCIV